MDLITISYHTIESIDLCTIGD